MDAHEYNQFQMVTSVQSFMDTNTVTWFPIAIISGIKTEIDDHVLGIRKNLKESGKSTKGITLDKDELHNNISIKSSILAGALFSYAAKTSNNDLKINSKLTKSDVINLRDIEIPERITLLTDYATTHLGALADYGVSAAQVTDLVTSVDDFRELIGIPRLNQSKTNLENKSAKEILKSVMRILNEELDNVMLQFQISNPIFYAGYEKARVIVD